MDGAAHERHIQQGNAPELDPTCTKHSSSLVTSFCFSFQHKILPKYVIEIIVPPWDPTDSRNKHAVGQMKAHPLHEDETGKVRMRRHAMVDTVKGFIPFSSLCNLFVKQALRV